MQHRGKSNTTSFSLHVHERYVEPPPAMQPRHRHSPIMHSARVMKVQRIITLNNIEAGPLTPHASFRCMPSTRAQGYPPMDALGSDVKSKQRSRREVSSAAISRFFSTRNEYRLTGHRTSDHRLLFYRLRDHIPHRPRCWYACPWLLCGTRPWRDPAHEFQSTKSSLYSSDSRQPGRLCTSTGLERELKCRWERLCSFASHLLAGWPLRRRGQGAPQNQQKDPSRWWLVRRPAGDSLFGGQQQRQRGAIVKW